MSTDATGVWVYAVISATTGDGLVEGASGVAGEPVRLIRAGDLIAVVGDVPLSEFGEAALRHNLEDLDWLSAKAQAHDRMVSQLMRSNTVVPLRMTTVYLSDAGVIKLLSDNRQEFIEALRAVTNRQELGVKAYADPKALTGELEPVSGADKLSGTAYLLRRRQELNSQEDAYRLAGQAAHRVHRELLRYAVEGKRKPPADHSLSGHSGWLVLNGTYLVEDSRVQEFRSAVELLEDELTGIVLHITGPWPPYSFVAGAAAS